MPLTFAPRLTTTLPVDFGSLSPPGLAQMSLGEAQRQQVLWGNRSAPLAELFEVTGSPADGVWHLEGDFSNVHRMAANMHGGQIHVHGDIGRHAAACMRQGTLHVDGNAGDWLAAELRGGLVRVAGSAGDWAGAAYVGSRVGMRGGMLLVERTTGDRAGEGMRRGWINLLGGCGELPGYRMRAGSLFVFGPCGGRPGLGMRRGTLGLFGTAPPLAPAFVRGCRYRPAVLDLMLRRMQQHGLAASEALLHTDIEVHSGDLLEGGRGEIWTLPG